MSKITPSALVAAAMALLPVAPVAAAPLGFTLAAQTESFSFYTRGSQKVEAQKTQSYLTEVQKALGHTFKGKAEYYRYESPEAVEAGTGHYAAGLTLPSARQIHSTLDFHAHEIVHLVAHEMGNPGSFFHEGLAVAVGNKGRWNGKPVRSLAKDALRRIALAAVMQQFDGIDTNVSYPVAGAFVASLIEKHGMDAVSGFFRNCPSPETRDAAFAAAFGISLADALDAWTRTL